MNSKSKKEIINKWIMKNGCVSFDLKNKDIIIHDGGLFPIESKKVKRHKIVGYKKLHDGYRRESFRFRSRENYY